MGYCFGAIFSIEQIWLYSFAFAVTWWINGLWFDLIHGTANALLCLLLYWPVFKVFSVLQKQYWFLFNNTFIKVSKIQ